MIGFRFRTLLWLPATLLAIAPPLLAAPVKQSAARPPAGSVTRAQMIAQSKAIFDRADTNHDGFMSRAEFAARMAVVINRDHPQTKAEAQQMLDAANRAFNDVDTNHDGKLSLAEATARPLKAFDMMDTNHDGILTLAEKRAAHEHAPTLRTVGPDQNGPGR